MHKVIDAFITSPCKQIKHDLCIYTKVVVAISCIRQEILVELNNVDVRFDHYWFPCTLACKVYDNQRRLHLKD